MNRRHYQLLALLAVTLFCGATRQEMYQRSVSLGYIRGGVLACDSFNGRTALASTDGVPYRRGGGLAWTNQSGTVAPASGALKASSAGIATIDPGVADAWRATFRATVAPNANSNALAFRFADTSNYVRCAVASGGVNFQTVIAGSAAGIGSATTGVTPSLGDEIVVTINGNSMTAQVFRAGAQVGTSATATNATGAGLTPIGFRFADTTVAFGSLVVTRL